LLLIEFLNMLEANARRQKNGAASPSAQMKIHKHEWITVGPNAAELWVECRTCREKKPSAQIVSGKIKTPDLENRIHVKVETGQQQADQIAEQITQHLRESRNRERK
jgi:hypothetical protein